MAEMSDLERYQAKANATTDNSLASTRNMLNMLEEVTMVVASQQFDHKPPTHRHKTRVRTPWPCWTSRGSSWTGWRATWTPSTRRWRRRTSISPGWRSGAGCSRAPSTSRYLHMLCSRPLIHLSRKPQLITDDSVWEKKTSSSGSAPQPGARAPDSADAATSGGPYIQRQVYLHILQPLLQF